MSRMMSHPAGIAIGDERTNDLVVLSLIAIVLLSALGLGIAVTPMDDLVQNGWTALSFL